MMFFTLPMTAMRRGALMACAGVAALLAGCVHPITMISETAPPRVQAHLVPKKVAYVMTDADRDLEVITPGGSGDRVSYYPYRDLEKSIRDALRAVYRDVVVLRTAGDAKANEAAGVSLVFLPRIKTESSSTSWISWPPTSFTVEVSCVVTDAAGAEVTRVRATGEGAAAFGEFKGDFGLAARRAATRLTSQLGSEIRRDEKLR